MPCCQWVMSLSRVLYHLTSLQFHHRDPGLVGLLASNSIPEGKTIYFGIISDGIHTHGAALRIAYRTHPAGMILVTDAISAMGLEEGTHRIGQFNIEVRDHRAYLSGTTTLCGSIAPMDECVRTFKRETNCPLVFALEAASLHPADCLKISDCKGTLNFGADADFILLDDDLKIHSTWIAGRCVFESAEHRLPKVSTHWTGSDAWFMSDGRETFMLCVGSCLNETVEPMLFLFSLFTWRMAYWNFIFTFWDKINFFE